MPAGGRRIALAATNLGYRSAARIGETLPYPAAHALSRAAARVAQVTMRGRREMVARHQQRASGGALDEHELRAQVRATFDSYSRYWLEMFRIPMEVRNGAIGRHFRVDGFEHVTAGVAAGRGTILALPHLGGWEWAGAWIAGQGHDLLAVVEPVEPPALFDWFVEQRRAFGLDIVPLGPDVSSRILRALRDNRIVCLLCDRDLTGDGVQVEFFGETTTLPAGPATLALRTGAALLPVATYFAPGQDHRAQVLPAIPTQRDGRLREDVARITQALACEFERLIREAPEQWHLLQPNWPSDRTGAPVPIADPSTPCE